MTKKIIYILNPKRYTGHSEQNRWPEQSACRFSRQWLTDIRHLESPQALRTAVWRTLPDRSWSVPWQSLREESRHLHFPADRLQIWLYFLCWIRETMFFFLMIFMAEPSVLSVTCSENTALSTLTWRWMILTRWRQQSSQIQKCFSLRHRPTRWWKWQIFRLYLRLQKALGHLWWLITHF